MLAKSLPIRNVSSTRLTLSTSSTQSKSEISRMLVMTLRTVTFVAPCLWCSSRTIASAVVPCATRRSSSHISARVTFGSWSRSRCASWTAKAPGKLRQVPIVGRRQIVANFADLLFDEMVVVEQPLGGRCNATTLADRAGDGAIRFEQNRFVVPQSYGEGSPGHRPRADRLGRCEALGMLLETLDAEELLADGLFVIPRCGLRDATESAKKCRSQYGV